MTTLSPAERTRLVNILGMLGSEHAGERASAAFLAAKLVRDRGLCLRHVEQLTQWEQGFVRSLAGRRNRSAKQTAMLGRLCEALRSRGFG